MVAKPAAFDLAVPGVSMTERVWNELFVVALMTLLIWLIIFRGRQ